MSTDFDLDRRWRLDGQTAVRPEPFGAMLYNFGTRGLSFLKRATLLEVLRGLEAAGSARAACVAAGVTETELPAYARALGALAASGMIVPGGMAARAGGGPAGGGPAGGGPAAGGPGGGPAGGGPAGGGPAAGGPGGGTAGGGPAGGRAAGGGSDGGRMQVPGQAGTKLAGMFERGLGAPVCLTWELTYACNLSCVHCLSSSGRRDPAELSTGECRGVIDALASMGVFYVNIGGGEPTVRPDFWDLVDYAVSSRVGVKFSTNGVRLDAAAAARVAGSDYVDVQISLDGATAEVNDAVRGPGSYATAIAAMEHLAAAGVTGFKLSVVMTRHNIGQLDAFAALAGRYRAQLRITRLRPSGRGADSWADLHPLPGQQRELYDWLAARPDQVLTGDSFFHLSGYGAPLPGLNMCGAGRVVCLIDPVGDVYACPFAIDPQFLAGNVRGPGGFPAIWRTSPLFTQLRQPAGDGPCTACSAYDSCRGGCMAAKFFTGLPLDGPDPECVRGHSQSLALSPPPRASADHSHRRVPVTIGARPPLRACDENPLAGLHTSAD